MENQRYYLPINLQFFADDEDGANNENNEKIDDNDEKVDVKVFTQEDVDRIVKERLDREKKKREEAVKKEREEAEKKLLEEQAQYKELADKYREELEAIKAEALTAKKESILAKAGYSDEQAKLLSKLLEGETDEELADSLKTLQATIPPKQTYVDPSVGNGEKEKPEQKDGTDIGKSMFERLKAKGKIR